VEWRVLIAKSQEANPLTPEPDHGDEHEKSCDRRCVEQQTLVQVYVVAEDRRFARRLPENSLV
jgi:hypothetical protein